MLLIILLVCFVLVMAIWLLIKLGAIQGNSDWLAFAAVLILGMVVFLYSSGVLVIERIR